MKYIISITTLLSWLRANFQLPNVCDRNEKLCTWRVAIEANKARNNTVVTIIDGY